MWVRVRFGLSVRSGPNENEPIASQSTRAITCSDAVVCGGFLCMQDKWTALMWAALNGQQDTVKLLLDHDAQVDMQDKVMSGDG